MQDEEDQLGSSRRRRAGHGMGRDGERPFGQRYPPTPNRPPHGVELRPKPNRRIDLFEEPSATGRTFPKSPTKSSSTALRESEPFREPMRTPEDQ